MRKAEIVVRMILGMTRRNIDSLVIAIEVVIDLLYYQKVPRRNIRVTKDVYPEVTKRIRKEGGPLITVGSVTKRIERHKCAK